MRRIETILAVKTTGKKTFKKQCLECHQQNSDVQQATYLLNVASVGSPKENPLPVT
jgi:cytochrome c2